MATFSIVAKDTYEHNHREIRTANAVFCNTENEYFFLKDKDDEIKKRTEAYQKNKGRKLDLKTILEREFILEVSENTTIDDLREAILNEFESVLDTKIFSIAIHRDEGELISKKDGTSFVSGDDFFYNEKTGVWSFENGLKYRSFEELEQDFIIKKNYHAHIIFSGLRSDGTSIKDYKNERVKNKEIEKFDTYFMQKWCVEKKEQLFKYLENQGKLTQKELENRKKNDDSLETPADSAIQNLLNKIANKIANDPSEDLKKVFGDKSVNFNFKKTFAFKHIMSDLNKLLRGEKLAKNEIKALKTNLKNAGVFDPIILKSKIIELSKKDLEVKYTKESVKNILKNLMNDEKYSEFKEAFLETYREIDKMKKAEFLAKYPDFQIFESVLNQNLERENKDLKNENEELKARIQELEAQNQKLVQENQELNEQIKAKDEKIQKLEEEKNDLKSLVIELFSENDDGSLTSTIESLQEKIEGFELQIEALKNNYAILNAQNAPLNQKEQENEQRQEQNEKNQNLSHSKHSETEISLSSVSNTKIDEDDDSALKILKSEYNSLFEEQDQDTKKYKL